MSKPNDIEGLFLSSSLWEREHEQAKATNFNWSFSECDWLIKWKKQLEKPRIFRQEGLLTFLVIGPIVKGYEVLQADKNKLIGNICNRLDDLYLTPKCTSKTKGFKLLP